MLTLSKQQVRLFLLYHQGFYPEKTRNRKESILNFIHRIGCIQFDPIDIAGRNADLVLQSRVVDYSPDHLNDLLYKDRRLVDGFDKNMSIYVLRDWPYFSRRRESARLRLGDPSHPVSEVVPMIRREIEARGPLSSIDINLDQKIDWSWAPASIVRAAMECMYFWGELIVHHRVNTRRFYDFASRHLPESLLAAPDPNLTEAAHHDWYVYRRIGGIGMIWNKAGDAWLGMGDIKTRERTQAIARLQRQGLIIEAQVTGLNTPVYFRSADQATLELAFEKGHAMRRAAVVAPLDNLIWDRKFSRELFDFSYAWEIYKPASMRQFGYYVLPILFGDRFVARFEPVRDRKNGTLIIQNWWWEAGVTHTKEMQVAVRDACLGFMKFNACKNMEIREEILKRERLDWLL